MGFFRNRRIDKAVTDALAGARDERMVARCLDRLPREDQADAWLRLARKLVKAKRPLEERRFALRAALLVDRDHFDAWALLADVELAAGEGRAALAASRELLRLSPRNPGILAEVILQLCDLGETEEALALYGDGEALMALGDPELRTRLGRALHRLDACEAAVDLLAPVIGYLDSALRAVQDRTSFDERLKWLEDVRRLHDDAFASVHGHEELVVNDLMSHRLDGASGANHRLLAYARMRESGRVAETLDLVSVAEEEARGRAHLAAGRKAAANLWLGSALLRQGAASSAERHFEKACDLDRTSFAGLLGLGTAKDAARLDLARRIKALPEPAPTPELLQVVPEYEQLSPVEQRALCATLLPLGELLEVVARAGAVLRFLPIDVRSVDRPELAEGAGEVTDDHRTVDAIDGLATEKLAVASITHLLDVASEHAWVVGHEVAHLVGMNLPDERLAPLATLHRKALRSGYVVGFYASSNLDEFVAGTYQELLHRRWGTQHSLELDDAGILQAALAWWQAEAAR
jgi:tetratricopeptide (TPR) repeat protein